MLSYSEIYEPVIQRQMYYQPEPVKRSLHLDGIHFILIYIFALFFMALTINK